MSLKDLILTRRSIGMFADTPVDPDLIQTLLETAVWTPNHRLTEPWRFILVAGAARDKVADIRRTMAYERSQAPAEDLRQKQADEMYQKIMNVPLILLVVMQPNSHVDIREEDYASCACLIQNFMLLAWEQGIGTNWKTFKEDPRLRDYLGITAGEKVVGFVHVGYPAELPQSRRIPAHERIIVMR